MLVFAPCQLLSARTVVLSSYAYSWGHLDYFKPSKSTLEVMQQHELVVYTERACTSSTSLLLFFAHLRASGGKDQEEEWQYLRANL
jgi:hypothetical protein